MSLRNRIVAVSVGVLLVAAGVSVGIRYSVPNLAPAPDRVSNTSAQGQHRRVVLAPVDGPAEKRRPAPETWQNVFAEMSKDQGTGAFLQHLYGGIPTELVAPTATTDQPPGKGFSIVVRIDPKSAETQWKQIASKIGGRADQPLDCLLGTLDYRRVARLKFTAGEAKSITARVASALEQEDNDLDIIVMAANDYLLREQKGWRMVNATSLTADRLAALSKDPVDVRRELDQQAEQWRQRYAPQGKSD